MNLLATQDGKIVLVGGKPSCACCSGTVGPSFEVAIKYTWEGTGQKDLDTQTTYLTESVGWSVEAPSGTYVDWLPGGSGATDDTTVNGFERIDVRVDTAKADGLWTDSTTIYLFAGWYIPEGGSGSAIVEVIYAGTTKSKTIYPGSQHTAASTPVGSVVVYSNGTFDLI